MLNAKRPRLVLESGDKYCVTCGLIVKGQAKDKISASPYKTCTGGMPFRSGWFGWYNGETFGVNMTWSRCTGHFCDAFISDLMLFCQNCGTKNAEAVTKKAQIEKENVIDQARKKDAFIRKLQFQVEEQKKALAEKGQKVAELEEMNKRQGDQIMMETLKKNGELDMDIGDWNGEPEGYTAGQEKNTENNGKGNEIEGGTQFTNTDHSSSSEK